MVATVRPCNITRGIRVLSLVEVGDSLVRTHGRGSNPWHQPRHTHVQDVLISPFSRTEVYTLGVNRVRFRSAHSFQQQRIESQRQNRLLWI